MFLKPGLIAACLLILAAQGPAAAEPFELSAKPLRLKADEETPPDTGFLVWRGGLVLASPDERFGGISGLLVDPDGRRAIAVTDNSHGITFALRHDEAGSLAGAEAAEIVTLGNLKGRPFTSKWQRDSESMALLSDGSILVGFEHRHRIHRYPADPVPFSRRSAGYSAPLGLAHAPDNEGLEALAVLEDGRVLAVIEGRETDTENIGYLGKDGLWSTLRFAKEGLFRPTGATRLPDGRIALLERRFTVLGGPAARVVVFEPDALEPGEAIVGREVGRLTPPFPVDNMEGIAARRGKRGETLVYLISDDNFFALQRTLLLMFELTE